MANVRKRLMLGKRWLRALVKTIRLETIREWLRRPELPLLVVLLIVIGASLTFIKLAEEVVEGDTQHFDRWMVEVLRDPANPSVPRGPRWLVEAGRDITALGGMTILTLVTLASAGYLFLERKTHAMWVMLLAVVSGVLLSNALKLYFARERPPADSDLVQVFTYSFPSGHSMLSAVVYLVLGAMLAGMEPRRAIRLYFLSLAILLTLLVGASRVYLGVHYPTDVLAGWTAGLAWALIWWLIARNLQRRGAVEPTGTAAARNSAR